MDKKQVERIKELKGNPIFNIYKGTLYLGVSLLGFIKYHYAYITKNQKEIDEIRDYLTQEGFKEV